MDVYYKYIIYDCNLILIKNIGINHKVDLVFQKNGTSIEGYQFGYVRQGTSTNVLILKDKPMLPLEEPFSIYYKNIFIGCGLVWGYKKTDEIF